MKKAAIMLLLASGCAMPQATVSQLRLKVTKTPDGKSVKDVSLQYAFVGSSQWTDLPGQMLVLDSSVTIALTSTGQIKVSSTPSSLGNCSIDKDGNWSCTGITIDSPGAGQVSLREDSSSSPDPNNLKRITLKSPKVIDKEYTLNLPTAPPTEPGQVPVGSLPNPLTGELALTWSSPARQLFETFQLSSLQSVPGTGGDTSYLINLSKKPAKGTAALLMTRSSVDGSASASMSVTDPGSNSVSATLPTPNHPITPQDTVTVTYWTFEK